MKIGIVSKGRYIDADELLRKLPDDLPYKASVKRVLMQAPTADVVEVRHGRWLPIIERSSYLDPPYYDTGKCSSCGHIVDVSEMHYKYCPNCGAKMDGQRRSDDEG